ncbi:aldo/keto reductase [Singulisphaera sp. PoT]|uniref:aldo/keto reductase n=1 Tax=Singulisphaera sp. PoT TaxID=3411797 RepID=UPI003BF489FA
MQLTTLGETGLAVSRMGIGLAALGRPGYINLGHAADLHGDLEVETMEAGAFEVLDAAREAGVRYLDAARSYGRAEAFLGRWLESRGIEPGSVTVGSKWGYTYTAGWKVEAEKHEVKDHSLATLRRQVVESRELLGSYLDLYQIHSATLESGVLENGEVLDELARLREGGLKVGLSVSGPRQAEVIRRAIEVNAARGRVFDCVQATWNLLETSASEALAEARKAGVGVIIKEGLANGRLTDRNAKPAFADKRSRLEKASAELGVTIDALALSAVLDQGWVDVVLSGAATVNQLRANLKALGVTWDASLRQQFAGFAEPANEYWETRAKLAWN